MNNVNLIGRITKDIELKTTKTNTSFISFTLACKRKQINNEGDKVTDFISCVAFGGKAEFLAKYACKSTLLGVSGRLQSKYYLDEHENKHSTVDVFCETVQILRMPKDESETVVNVTNTDEEITTPSNDQFENDDNNDNQVNNNSDDDSDDDDSEFDKMLSNFSTFFKN